MQNTYQLKKLVAIFLVAILASSVTVPRVFSDDGNKDEVKDSDKTIHFEFSNATSVHIILPNGTKITFGFSNGTNVGQQVSTFVHEMHDIFKQQENMSKQQIKDCREKAREASSPAEKKNIMDECKVKLKEIKNQFSNERRQFQVDFTQLREIIIDNNQQVHEKLPTKNSQQIQNKTLGMIHGLQQKIHGLEQKLLERQKVKNQGHGKQD